MVSRGADARGTLPIRLPRLRHRTVVPLRAGRVQSRRYGIQGMGGRCQVEVRHRIRYVRVRLARSETAPMRVD